MSKTQDLMYIKGDQIFAKDYLEIYIPIDYFDDEFAVDKGLSIETFGLMYCKGKEGPIKFINIPTTIDVQVYDSSDDEITLHNKTIKVRTLKFLKDAFLFKKSTLISFTISEKFVNMVLAGKIPSTINYPKLINIWWNNNDIGGLDSQAHSKIFELIIAAMYRDPRNMKRRYGEVYGKKDTSDGYDYKTGSVRDIVQNLSTFSGFVFEDTGRMITSGINNSIDEVEEPNSPLEKIIHY